jgi:DNA-binding PadR family transcriptional regulator
MDMPYEQADWEPHWRHGFARWAMLMGAREHGRPRRPPFPGFGPWGEGRFPEEPFFGRGPKVGRGDVRAAILALLAEAPMHGYQIIQELTSRSEGVWRPSPGSVYPTLAQLEDEGMVEVEKVDGKRIFRLTDQGKAEVAERPDGPAPWELAAPTRSLMGLREIGGGVAAAVMQVARTGNEAQIARAREILGEARKSLYKLLAEDDDLQTPKS